ncbi:receptor-like protein kinase FERONIA [Cucumis melo var. makuwa]|uniref:Receptor-like protein kinase FERONIA n=1 Tax=Cucumis melo var. makuwa TaxID=1194695 RepID=A0A5A7U3S7_CUCMM|nr:receptor-like protein kinase FERONIA [Cucumis melo var. makuwa]
MNIRNKLSIEYRERVFKFLDIVKYHIDEYGQIRYERFYEGTSSNPFHEGTRSSDPFHIEGTSSNLFSEDNEMLGMLHDLQSLIKHDEETIEEASLKNDMSFNSGVKEEMMNIFQKLLNQACRELYPGYLEFSSLNFLVTLMHVKQNESYVTWAWDKILFMHHRSKLHDGSVERRPPPVILNEHDILEQIDSLEFPMMSKHSSLKDKKRKRPLNWTKISTQLNIEEKTKDTMNARLNLQDLKIRKNLHLIEVGTTIRRDKFKISITRREVSDPLVIETRERNNLFLDFFSLAMGPSPDVRSYTRCIMGRVVQVVQNNRISDIPEVDDVEDQQLNVPKIVVSDRVADHVEDDTLCRVDVDPTVVERSVVHHVVDDFINDDNEQLSVQSRPSNPPLSISPPHISCPPFGFSSSLCLRPLVSSQHRVVSTVADRCVSSFYVFFCRIVTVRSPTGRFPRSSAKSLAEPSSFSASHSLGSSRTFTEDQFVLGVLSSSPKTNFVLGVPLDSPKTRDVPTGSLDYMCSRTCPFKGKGKGRGKLANDKK